MEDIHNVNTVCKNTKYNVYTEIKDVYNINRKTTLGILDQKPKQMTKIDDQ